MTVSLEDVTKNDWDFILKLRNNEQIRKFMTHDEIISKDVHYSYLEKQKSNPKFLNKIISFENNKVGYIRVDDDDISIFVDPTFQGKGIASKALELFEPIAKSHGFTKLVGKVLIDNKQSEKIFLKNGFVHSLNLLEKTL